ncbi:MAG: hypothetical protein ACON5A_04185 [Candidatus Comchoanobacterales bacterium]
MKKSKLNISKKLYQHHDQGISITLDGNYQMLELKLPENTASYSQLSDRIKEVYQHIVESIQDDIRKDLMQISQAIGNIKDERAE